jgi:mevalonate kinase
VARHDSRGSIASREHNDSISIESARSLAAKDYKQLGALMNLCEGLPNAIEVSTRELQRIVEIARRNGGTGAKLTGVADDGSIVALAPGTADRLERPFAISAIKSFETLTRCENKSSHAKLQAQDCFFRE